MTAAAGHAGLRAGGVPCSASALTVSSKEDDALSRVVRVWKAAHPPLTAVSSRSAEAGSPV